MDVLDARSLVAAAIREIPADVPLAIDDARTRESDDWWIFFYDRAEAIESGRREHRLFGVAPVVVDRRSGDVLFAPSWKPFDQFLMELEPGGPNLAW